MPITFRYDAAAVVPPSNQTTRKYGQNLVLQQQQQKYLGQQAANDRLFTLGRDQQQATRQAITQGQQNARDTIRDVNQNANLVERQNAQNKFLTEQQKREQAAADFTAARGRMDTHAKDALKNPDLPPELRQKIQTLVNGKLAAMGSGFNETQQQQFLDQYNSQLAALLSEVPPQKPKAPPQPNFHTDPNGNQWVESGPGKWAQVPQQQKPPTSAAEAFKADPKVAAKYEADARALTLKGGELTRDNRKEIGPLAAKLWEDDNLSAAPTGYGTSSAAYYNAPDSGSRQAPAATQAAPSGIPVAPPDQGVPPSPQAPQEVPGTPAPPVQPPSAIPTPIGGQAIRGASANGQDAGVAAAYHADMTGQGYKLVTPPDGSRPYYLKDSTPIVAEPAQAVGVPPDVSAKVDAYVAGQSPDESLPEFQAAQKQLENNGMKVPGTSSGKQPTAPDFGSLAASAKTDADRGELQSMKDIYNGLKPEAKQAMNVILSDSATTEQKAAANRALLQMGINLQVELSKRAIVPEAEFPSAMM